MMTEFVLDLASCTTGRVYTVRVIQVMRGTHLYKDWTLDTTHFYCPPVTLKWKSDDLFFAWSRNLHDGACGPRLGAHSVWQLADERVTAVSKTGHTTLLLPLSGVLCLEAVMSDKMCVCVCVYNDSFQAGFPNRFLCVFCTSFRYFWCIPMHMQPKSVSFSSPLACSSCLALKRICCHCHYQHVFVLPGSVYCHLVKYSFSLGASIRSRTLPWILYEQNPSTMKCSRGQRPFLIGNEHKRSHKHSKHSCFLIDLASTSWCLDFACTVFTAVFGSESRHPKRSRIWQDGGIQIQARQGKHADNGSGSIYVWEQGKRNKQGERKETLILAACALVYIENTEERCRKQRNLFGNPAWKLSVHTHFITHDSF